MSIVKLKDENSFNIYHQTFLIDDDTDLNTLEQIYNCNLGDEARLPNGTIYIRHSDNYSGDLWEAKSSSSGAGGNSGNCSCLPTVTSADNGDFLSVINGEWNKKQPPYSIEKIIIVPEQDITFSYGSIAYYSYLSGNIETPVNGNFYTVIFDGVEYNIQCTFFNDNEWCIGEVNDGGEVPQPSFTNFPIYIGYMGDHYLVTVDPTNAEYAEGTHTVEVFSENIIITEDFSKVINFEMNTFVVQVREVSNSYFELNMTWQEIYNAMINGKVGFIVWNNPDEGLISLQISWVSDSNEYIIGSCAGDMAYYWTANESDDYPFIDETV